MTTSNVGEDAEKPDDLYIVSGNVKWYGHSRKSFANFLPKKKKLQIPYGPAISFLGIYPREIKIGFLIFPRLIFYFLLGLDSLSFFITYAPTRKIPRSLNSEAMLFSMNFDLTKAMQYNKVI